MEEMETTGGDHMHPCIGGRVEIQNLGNRTNLSIVQRDNNRLFDRILCVLGGEFVQQCKNTDILLDSAVSTAHGEKRRPHSRSSFAQFRGKQGLHSKLRFYNFLGCYIKVGS